MNKKVIIAGHICLDITPVFLENKENMQTELMKPGSLITDLDKAGKVGIEEGIAR